MFYLIFSAAVLISELISVWIAFISKNEHTYKTAITCALVILSLYTLYVACVAIYGILATVAG